MSDQINQEPNFNATIPSYVRYCKALEPCARLLYGELTALANRYGYCWASNEYFAELYDVNISTIKRWITSLRDQKFIKIEIENEGIIKRRKIWISQEIQKMFTKAQKRAQGGLKNEPSKGIKKNNTKEESLSIRILKEECPNGPSASKKSNISFEFETKKFSGITEDQIKSWEKEFPKINVRETIPKIEEWCAGHPTKVKKRKNFERTIVHWFKTDQESVSYNQDQKNKIKEKNIKIVKEIQTILERSQFQGCNLSIQGTDAYDSVKLKRCPLDSSSLTKIVCSWYGLEDKG